MTQAKKKSLDPVVFLDRDGVLIQEKHYLSDLSQIEFYLDVPAGLKRLKSAGFTLIVITNQSGVARGYYPENFVKEAYLHLNKLLESEKVQLDGHYYCPHYKTGNPPYDIDCDCRKPRPGMINQASLDFRIDFNRSFLIGDKLSDITLAHNTGLKPIQLITGHGGGESMKVRYSYPGIPILKDFKTAVDYIIAKVQES